MASFNTFFDPITNYLNKNRNYTRDDQYNVYKNYNFIVIYLEFIIETGERRKVTRKSCND